MVKRKGIRVNVPFSSQNYKRIEENIKEVLEISALDVVQDIRANADSIFDSGGEQICQELWYSDARKSGGSYKVEMGWDNNYGKYLEWPPPIKEWTIVPRGFSVKGKPLKYLRFYSKKEGKIVYRKRVNRVWNKKSLRPHYGPALERVIPTLLKRLRGAIRGK